MRINQNISAMNTHASMIKSDQGISKSLERLSSGLRINRAADDAAGLAISEKMRGQIRGLQQATRNAQDGISLLQTAEGALNETHSILQRMRELAVQSANDTLTNTDRGEIQKEMDQLTVEVDRIAGSTQFNTKTLLSGQDATVERFARSGAAMVDADGAGAGAATGTITLSSQVKAGDTVSIGGLQYTFGSTSDTSSRRVAIGADVNASAANLAAVVTGADSRVTAAAVATNVVTITSVATNGSGTYALDFNTGKDDTSLTMHIGANAGQSMSASLGNMDSAALGIGRDNSGIAVAAGTAATKGLDVSTQTAANAAITALDSALSTVSSERSRLGAFQNRLEHTISNLGAASENLTSSESRIRDVDMAEEMANFSRSQILMQASTAMMAQANQKPQAVLKLLG